VKADPALAKIAHELVESIRTDLTVDWADREATEAKIRTKIKRVLRKHKYRPPKTQRRRVVAGDHGVDYARATRPSTRQRPFTDTGLTWTPTTGYSSDERSGSVLVLVPLSAAIREHRRRSDERPAHAPSPAVTGFLGLMGELAQPLQHARGRWFEPSRAPSRFSC